MYLQSHQRLLRKLFFFFSITLISHINGITIVNRYIKQNKYKGPCGCIALMRAGELSKRTKHVVRVIKKARREKKDLTMTLVLSDLAREAGLNLHCLMMRNGKPHVLGEIFYYPPQTSVEAYIAKTKRILSEFRRGARRMLHFICHITCAKVEHGFLITLDKTKHTLTYHTDCITKKNRAGVMRYARVLAQWYQDA